MKPVNIYILTRIKDTRLQQRLERQMSGRKGFLNIKEWEMDGLRKLSGELSARGRNSEELCFYYSFVMPKLGKEFDLLRISENSVVNIELKSGNISDEAIRKQLLKNRYYLSTLAREIHSYTYISNENRLMKLSNNDRLQEADWEQLLQNLQRQVECYQGEIEELFKEEQYLISPLSDPEHFLRREYFLTSQQTDIKKRMLQKIRQDRFCYQGFTGLPGTGKSILLYDMAIELSWKKRVCILHMGTWPEGMNVLNSRLKRVDFYYCEPDDEILIREKYDVLLVDEGHWITETNLKGIRNYTEREKIPVIFAYDREDFLSASERENDGGSLIEHLPGMTRYQLTNRIRVNGELSSFIYHVMKEEKHTGRSMYPSVRLAYADTEAEARILLDCFKANGYQYIRNDSLQGERCPDSQSVVVGTARCMEFERVVMLVDSGFYYDEKGYLRAETGTDTDHSAVRGLYHGLNRAKKELALIVLNNMTVFEKFLHILQK